MIGSIILISFGSGDSSTEEDTSNKMQNIMGKIKDEESQKTWYLVMTIVGAMFVGVLNTIEMLNFTWNVTSKFKIEQA